MWSYQQGIRNSEKVEGSTQSSKGQPDYSKFRYPSKVKRVFTTTDFLGFNKIVFSPGRLHSQRVSQAGLTLSPLVGNTWGAHGPCVPRKVKNPGPSCWKANSKRFQRMWGLEPTGTDGSGGREGSGEGRSGDTEEERRFEAQTVRKQVPVEPVGKMGHLPAMFFFQRCTELKYSSSTFSVEGTEPSTRDALEIRRNFVFVCIGLQTCVCTCLQGAPGSVGRAA